MIDPKHEVSITRQAELVGISRAAVYYVPRPVSEADLALQRRIDELHLEYPFAGALDIPRSSDCRVIETSCFGSIIALRSACPPW